eukprot:scaffold9330_cov117-Isochrysis_galbana.AAC.5
MLPSPCRPGAARASGRLLQRRRVADEARHHRVPLPKGLRVRGGHRHRQGVSEGPAPSVHMIAGCIQSNRKLVMRARGSLLVLDGGEARAFRASLPAEPPPPDCQPCRSGPAAVWGARSPLLPSCSCFCSCILRATTTTTTTSCARHCPHCVGSSSNINRQ